MADQRRIELARTMASRMKRNSYTQVDRRQDDLSQGAAVHGDICWRADKGHSNR